ncbi:MAG: YlbF family regulator [Candidatus Limnocylindrales bacterium]
MLRTELYEAAVYLGRALRRAPAVAVYRAATEAFEADPDAKELIAQLRERQSTVILLQRGGGAATQEQLDVLRQCQMSVRANQTIMAHLRATNDVKAFLPAVAGEVSVALGADYVSLIAPTAC